MVYEPREDSSLLKKEVSRLAYGRVLDMGTGLGPQAFAAACSEKVLSVLAVDIDPEAIRLAKSRNPHKKITYKVSDLFKKVQGSFDTIIFNPPYLPSEQGLDDPALVGGRHGYEIICRFLKESLKHLAINGQILMVYSSLTKPARVDECARALLFDESELGREHIFFEDIIAMRFSRSRIREHLERDGFSDLSYLAKGKRGLVFCARYKKKKTAVKIRNPASEGDSIIREARMLEILNKHKIGPKLIKSSDDYLAEEFIEGLPILDFAKTAKKSDILKVIRAVLLECRVMDQLGISKQEMTMPLKHIIVRKNKKPILIDFERARYTQKPQNITQFLQFISCGLAQIHFASKGIAFDPQKAIELSKEYKGSMSDENFKVILGFVK